MSTRPIYSKRKTQALYFFYRNKFRPTANETNQVQKHLLRPSVTPPSAQQDIEGDVFLTGEISKIMKCLMFVSFSPHHAAAPSGRPDRRVGLGHLDAETLGSNAA
jgi:hypothetical protein